MAVRVLTEEEKKDNPIKAFAIGEYAEGMGWQVLQDYIHLNVCETPICPHAEYLGEAKYYEGDSRVYKLYRLKRAIKAYNEGGYNCTLMCVDCVLEGVK